MRHYLYILECINGSFYTGYTVDLERRYLEHTQGSPKCKYTRSFPPVKIAASWEFDCELSEILKLEHWVKQLSKKEKIKLIENKNLLAIQCKKK